MRPAHGAARRLTRVAAPGLLAAVALALGASGCGGDDELRDARPASVPDLTIPTVPGESGELPLASSTPPEAAGATATDPATGEQVTEAAPGTPATGGTAAPEPGTATTPDAGTATPDTETTPAPATGGATPDVTGGASAPEDTSAFCAENPGAC